MFALDKFIDHRVHELITAYRKSRSSDLLPVDLQELARLAGVTDIIEQEMIPEAVLQVSLEGFRISVQSNFGRLAGTRFRKRFSIAHEIGHVFFYDASTRPARPLQDAPTGDKLELACHRIAELLLIPQGDLRREIAQLNDFPRAEQLIELSTKFDVSVEVLLRRLRREGLFNDPERTHVLVRGEDDLIDYAVFPVWLGSRLREPTRGHSFSAWFGESTTGSQPGAHPWVSRNTASGPVYARRVAIASSLALYEIAIEEGVLRRSSD